MRKRGLIVLWLTVAVLSTSCVAYRIKEMSAEAVAAKGKRAKIIAVRTDKGYLEFLEKEPARVVNGALVGKVHAGVEIDPYDIAESTRVKKRVHVVMKDGTRYEVLSSRDAGDRLSCEVLVPTCVPLDEVVKAKVNTTNVGGTILATLGGAALVAAALALDSSDDDTDDGWDLGDEILSSLFDSLLESSCEPGPRRSIKQILALKESPKIAEETELWVMEWTPLDVSPDADGKVRVRFENSSGAPRGVDEAKLVVADHPPGVGVAPDIKGIPRVYLGAVAPARAVDRMGRDIAPLVDKKDGVLWRTPGGDSAPKGPMDPRDVLTFEFPRPAGARKAKLIVTAANTMWRAQFAREALERAAGAAKRPGGKPVYREGEFSRLGVLLETVFGWQTGQVLFAGGPLPAQEVIYGLDLGDVKGDKVRIKLEPPAGYWLIDHLAMDFEEHAPVDWVLVDAGAVDSPDSAEVLLALAADDGEKVFHEDPGSRSVLTFAVPPLKNGMVRTLFLRTLSCYEMPPRGPAASPDRRGLTSR